MPTFARLLSVVLALGLLLASPRAAFAGPDFSSLESFVAAEMRQAQVPGCAIAIVVDGELAWARGVGVANVDSGQPVSADMLFRIGSTTKMFTAAGLVILAEEGRVELNSPLGRVAPGLKPALARLTPHQLLTHTAGLSDHNAMTGPHDETALADRVRALDAKDFFDEPGRIYSYSNPGYWVAGFVAEAVSGRPYADHLHERLFQPLGMTRTTFRPTMAMTWPLAVGHGPEGRSAPHVIRPLADNAAVWPAGQLFTSAPEFARFCIAFMAGGRIDGRQVLSPAVIEQLGRPHVPVPNEDRHYGYGLGVRRDGELRWLAHGGSRTGYGSLVRMCPEKRFAVVILCNKTGASLPKVADHVALLALGAKPEATPTKKPIAMSADEMARYAGTYANGRGTIVLRVRNGRLVGAQGGVIARTGERRFVRAAAGNTPALEFSLAIDAAGRVTHLMTRGRAWRKTD